MTSKKCALPFAVIAALLSNSCRPRKSSQLASAAASCGSDNKDAASGKTAEPNYAPAPVGELKAFSAQDVVTKQPLLIYYAVDTKEPYFQATLDLELKQLKSACDGSLSSKRVNWIALVNSHYVRGRKYLVCKNGQLLPPQSYPSDLDAKLQLIKSRIEGGFSGEYMNLTFHVRFLDSDENRKAFSEYIFAHPETLRYLLEFAQTQVFNEGQFVPFLHMKSHGSSRLFLTGLTKEETDKKTVCQVDTLNSAPSSVAPKNQFKDWTTRVEQIYGNVGMQDFPELTYIANVAGLSTPYVVPGLNNKESGLNNKESGLNNKESGLNNKESGLNNKESGLNNKEREPGLNNKEREPGLGGFGTTGLSSNNYFGLDEPAFLSVLVYLNTRKIVHQPLGFVFAESCDSNVSGKPLVKGFFDSQPEIMGHFSAIGSLHYHNIDWHEFYRTWQSQNGNIVTFQTALAEKARTVPNEMH